MADTGHLASALRLRPVAKGDINYNMEVDVHAEEVDGVQITKDIAMPGGGVMIMVHESAPLTVG
jgi:hypothetical protein